MTCGKPRTCPLSTMLPSCTFQQSTSNAPPAFHRRVLVNWPGGATSRPHGAPRCIRMQFSKRRHGCVQCLSGGSPISERHGTRVGQKPQARNSRSLEDRPSAPLNLKADGCRLQGPSGRVPCRCHEIQLCRARECPIRGRSAAVGSGGRLGAECRQQENRNGATLRKCRSGNGPRAHGSYRRERGSQSARKGIRNDGGALHQPGVHERSSPRSGRDAQRRPPRRQAHSDAARLRHARSCLSVARDALSRNQGIRRSPEAELQHTVSRCVVPGRDEGEI